MTSCIRRIKRAIGDTQWLYGGRETLKHKRRCFGSECNCIGAQPLSSLIIILLTACTTVATGRRQLLLNVAANEKLLGQVLAHSVLVHMEERISAAQRDARRYTCTASPFVQHDLSPARATMPLCDIRLRLHFVARQGMGREFGYRANVLLLSPISSGSKSQPPQPTAARVGPRVRCDYYVFMTAVVDIRLVTKKCRSFTNLQT